MTKPNASSCATSAERAASLMGRIAQLEATLNDPDADDIELQNTAASLAQLAAVAADERVPSTEDDAPNNVDSAELHNARAAVADLHRRIADQLDPRPMPRLAMPGETPEREVALAINEDWINSTLAQRGLSTDDYDASKILDQLENLWNYEHLENRAQELIEYALELSITSP